MIIEIDKINDLISRVADIVSRSDNTEEATKVIEDVADTINEYVTYKARYEENDTAWRKRYTDRFMGRPTEEDNEADPEIEVEVKEKIYSYDDLFKEEK